MRCFYYKNALFSVTKTEAIPYYKTQFPDGYQDVHYYLNYCPFGCKIPPDNRATGCDNDASIALYYYAYYPTNFVDYNNCSLPALIMFHSGAYSECSSPDQDGLDYLCRAMAARGFVVFSVSYRVGVLADQTVIPTAQQDLGPKDEYVSAQQILAIYRACQDARGAIRSIILANDTATYYKINTGNIFVGGLSAGSLIAMNSVYYQTESMLNAVFPNVSFALGGTNASINGSINPDFYAAPPPAIGDADYFPNIKGVLNLWGSMFVPKANINNPAQFFAADAYKPPIISFAGVQDQVSDIHNQRIYFSKNNVSQMLQICNAGPTYTQNFGIETNCLATPSYKTQQNSMGTRFDQYGIGSETIFHMFDDNNIFAELYLDCEMMHGLDKDDHDCGTCTSSTDPFKKPGIMSGTCIQCAYQSNFGTLANSQMLTYDYMAGRIATFFQAIITNNTNIPVNNKFVEQINNRYGCMGTDNPISFTKNTCDGDTHQ
ncbi:MAG: hypothetical protein ABJB05_11155 [Parafilimonas sp.]